MSPTITEIIGALDKLDSLVGVSNYCSYPKLACSKAKVGSALTPDIEKIMELTPDIILSQKMQNSSLDRKASRLGLKVLNLKFDSLSDVQKSITEVSKKLSSSKGRGINEELNSKMSKLKGLKKKGHFLVIVDVYEKMGRVTGVLVAGNGTFYSDILKLTGLENKANKTKNGEYKKITLEDLLEMKGTSFFIFSPKKTQKEELLKRELMKFKASNHQYYSFENDYAVIPGPRLSLLIEDILKRLK